MRLAEELSELVERQPLGEGLGADDIGEQRGDETQLSHLWRARRGDGVVGRGASRPAAARKRLVLPEDRCLEVAERLPRFEAELLAQDAASVLIGRERLCLPP